MPKLTRATAVFLDRFQCKPDRPDLGLLGNVAAGFANLPWENLTKYLRKHRAAATQPSSLPERLRDVPGAERLRLSGEVMDDHVRLGSGGTCFSLTNALRRIVTDLGFHAYPVMADMRHGPNIHCGLLVELNDRKYLLDPGYLVAEPVTLAPGVTSRVSHPGHSLEYRPVEGSDDVELHTVSARGETLLRYRMRPRTVPENDFLRFWVESFDASGMNGLHLNRITSDARLSAHDFNLRIDSGRDKHNVKLRDRYVESVSDRFGVDRALVQAAFSEWRKRRCRTE